MLALKAEGVSTVYVVDVIDSRLKRAKDLGATETINGKNVDPVAEIMRLTNGRGVDLIIETSGTDVASA